MNGTVTMVPWRKSLAKHHLVIGASFEMVTFIVRNESHLIRNISQKGPTNMKSHPIIITATLREVYK